VKKAYHVSWLIGSRSLLHLEKLHIPLATKMRKFDIGISGKNMFGKLANILLVQMNSMEVPSGAVLSFGAMHFK